MPSGTGEAKGGWVLARWGDSGSHPRRTITCDGMDRFLVNTEVVAYIVSTKYIALLNNGDDNNRIMGVII